MLSIVIPVLNEADSLPALHAELSDVAQEHAYDVQMVFIDDGSTDRSWAVIQQLAEADPRIHGIRFRRNFGKAAALMAGFRAARGEQVMTMDADLQDNPAEIPSFLAKLDEGYDVVSGWKKVRHDPWHKVYPSRVFNGLVSWLNGVKLHDHNCGMKCYRRTALDEIHIYGELHRFLPVLAAARGFRVGEVVVHHRARKFGRSKYGVERLVKGFLDLITVKFLTGYGHRPLHVLGAIGLGSFLLGVFLLTYLAVYWMVSRISPGLEPVHLHQGAALYYSLGLLIIGSQFLAVGILGELITSHQAREVESYSVAETTAAARGESWSKADIS